MFRCRAGRLATALLVLVLASSVGCTTRGRKAAGQGAATGALAGAVGGLVVALIFGGDPVEAAARSAVYGASAGAVAGGVAGDRQERELQKQREQKLDARLAKLRSEIGDDAFRGLEALADCKHDVAIGYGKTAARSDNRDHALAGLWLEVLAEADRRQESKARALLPEIVEKDPKLHSLGEAEQRMREGSQALMHVRGEYDMPQVCAA
jgi:hypothetical protein